MKVSGLTAILLVLVISQTHAFFTLFEEELRRDQEGRPIEGRTRAAEAEAAGEQQEAGEEAESAPVTRHDINLLRRDIAFALEHLRRTIERYGGGPFHRRLGWHYPGLVSDIHSYYPGDKQP